MRSSSGRTVGWMVLGLAAGFCGCGENHAADAETPDGRASVRVTGTTLEASTGALLEGVVIEGPRGVRAVSDAAGRFTLPGLAVGDSGILRASHPDGLAGELPLPPLAGGRREVVFHLRLESE